LDFDSNEMGGLINENMDFDFENENKDVEKKDDNKKDIKTV